MNSSASIETFVHHSIMEKEKRCNHPAGSRKSATVLIVGPSAPPYNGMTRAIELIVVALNDDFSVMRLDTADRRGLSNIGRFELGNLFLAAKHGVKFLLLLLLRRPRIVYIPISQSWLPFLRDCLFLVPARLFRRKVVLHLHGGYFGRFYQETSPLMRWIIRQTLGKACCAIVLGKNVVDAFDGILPRDRIRIVPNGIPDDFAGGTPLGWKGSGTRAPIVLYLATLTAEKGFLDLLRALPRVRERCREVRALFAGEWFSKSDKEAATRLLDNHGLEDVVEFIGRVGPERRTKLLEDAHIFAFPTAYRYEGHPYVILEAMSAGLPIVSTDVASIPETIRDGVEGFLIRPGDIQTLAERVGRLLTDNTLRNRMGHASRQRYLQEFTYDRFAERIKDVFAEQTQSA
jgi:glycosyltransferase involved in cell wall biosynthesis